MARTRTPGIRIDRDGRCIIDKERHGVGTYLRLGPTSNGHAERRLAHESARIDSDLMRKTNPRQRFVDCTGSSQANRVASTTWPFSRKTHAAPNKKRD